MEGVGMLIGATFGALIMYQQRKAVAGREVRQLADRGGWPADAVPVEAAERWYGRRQAAIALGAWVGCVAGTVVFLRLGAEPEAFAWWGALGVTGVGVALCLTYYAAARAGTTGGPRVAVLRQRRLGEFLSPVEIALQFGFLLLPVLALAAGVPVVAVVGAVALVAGAGLLQHLVLGVNDPVGAPAELRWVQARRAVVLRDLSSVMIGASWALGGLTAFSAVLRDPESFPALLEPLAWVLFSVATVLFVRSVLSPARERVAR